MESCGRLFTGTPSCHRRCYMTSQVATALGWLRLVLCMQQTLCQSFIILQAIGLVSERPHQCTYTDDIATINLQMLNKLTSHKIVFNYTHIVNAVQELAVVIQVYFLTTIMLIPILPCLVFQAILSV